MRAWVQRHRDTLIVGFVVVSVLLTANALKNQVKTNRNLGATEIAAHQAAAVARTAASQLTRIVHQGTVERIELIYSLCEDGINRGRREYNARQRGNEIPLQDCLGLERGALTADPGAYIALGKTPPVGLR